MNEIKSKFGFDYRGWVIPIVFIILWILASKNQWVDPVILPKISEVGKNFVNAAHDGAILQNIVASVSLNISGFFFGGLIGVIAGLVLGAISIFDRFFSPTLNALKHVAVFAWIPILIMWFGHGDLAKTIFVSLVVFYPVFYNTYDGVKQVPPQILEVANIYQFGTFKRFIKVILPAAAPNIFAGLNIALVFSWLATIGAEYFFVAKEGVVNPILDGASLFDMAQIIYGMIVIGIVGLIFHSIAQYFEKRNLQWRQQGHK